MHFGPSISACVDPCSNAGSRARTEPGKSVSALAGVDPYPGVFQSLFNPFRALLTRPCRNIFGTPKAVGDGNDAPKAPNPGHPPSPYQEQPLTAPDTVHGVPHVYSKRAGRSRGTR